MSPMKVVPYVSGVTTQGYSMTPGVPGALEPRMYPRSGYFLIRYNSESVIINFWIRMEYLKLHSPNLAYHLLTKDFF